MVKEFDEILEMVGGYGRYQKIMIFVISIITYLLALPICAWIFITFIPEYWCEVPGIERTNYTIEEWMNLTVPRDESGQLEKCSKYEVLVDEDSLFINHSNTEDCATWDFDRTQFKSTIGTSLGWLCGKQLRSTHLMFVFMIMNAIGSFILPLIADVLTGRRLMFYIATFIFALFSLLILATDNYEAIVALRIISGIGAFTTFQMPFIIAVELLTPEKRVVCNFALTITWCLGICTTSFLAWLVPYWNYLMLLCTLPLLTYFLLWWFLPESPRFLLSRDRIAKCSDVVMTIARWNGVKDVTKERIVKELRTLNVKEEKLSLKELLRHPRILFIYTIISILAFGSFTSYGCLFFNVGVLESNYYLGHFIIALSELPGVLLGYCSCHYLGRKFSLIFGNLFTIPICIGGVYIIQNQSAVVGFMVILKILSRVQVFTLYLLTPEVLPTPFRSTGLGVMSLFGAIGVSISPYIIAAGMETVFWSIFGMSVAMLFISILVPETLGLPLPQTFIEADQIFKGRPLLRWIHHWNRGKYEAVPVQEPRHHHDEPDSNSNVQNTKC